MTIFVLKLYNTERFIDGEIQNRLEKGLKVLTRKQINQPRLIANRYDRILAL
jgi:hypothetical protein